MPRLLHIGAHTHAVTLVEARIRDPLPHLAKTDPIDARKLAELLRVDCLPAIWLPDVDARRRRQLLRGRAFLVRQRTQVKNRLHWHLMAVNHCCPTSDLYGKTGRAWLMTVPLSPMLSANAMVSYACMIF